jgi:hypothetical protein
MFTGQNTPLRNSAGLILKRNFSDKVAALFPVLKSNFFGADQWFKKRAVDPPARRLDCGPKTSLQNSFFFSL